ncbi:hypothetical protein [Nonomuraea bangladeshensis]|uniref:hypothetical protein n=1 Tax=Nonomuraea bangladeshensis TaxID=404385 RepID=UPI0031D42B3A
MRAEGHPYIHIERLTTFYEGLVCAFLWVRNGVIPAALAHGTAIFLLASALV